MKRQFIKVSTLCILTLALGLAANTAAKADEAVYKSAVRSTVLIAGPNGTIGSGALVDAERRLVVTANHVPGTSDAVKVFFAQPDQSGRIITDRDWYKQNADRLAIPARVVARNPKADVALLELESLPAGIKALPLAQANPGQAVHVIGNSSIRYGGVFGYRSGRVANVYKVKPDARIGLDCWVLENDISSNHGDSGGPVLNDRGQLVGIVSKGTDGVNSSKPGNPYEGAQSTNHDIDAGEVQLLLDGLKRREAPAEIPVP